MEAGSERAEARTEEKNSSRFNSRFNFRPYRFGTCNKLPECPLFLYTRDSVPSSSAHSASSTVDGNLINCPAPSTKHGNSGAGPGQLRIASRSTC